jgi:alkaline phosphatase D
LTGKLPRNLAAVAALAVLSTLSLAAQEPPPDPAAWLRSGPMLGPAELTATTVWLQTRLPCRVQVRFWPQGHPDAARVSDEMRTTAEGDLIARLHLTGLQFGTRYDYEVYLDGFRVARSYPLTFETQPMWRWRGNPPSFRAAVGSCAYINDPPYDRPGDPYGGDYQIFQSIAAAKPDFMVWLGDDVYYREADWTTEAGMRRRWAHDRALPELQPLLGAVHHYAMWDDHDYGSNDSDRTFRDRATSLRVFQDYWLNPTYGTPETPGVFTRFTWGDVEFFLLDDRSFRAPDDAPPGPDKRMFGAAQMRWLEEALTSSEATFKIVAGGSQMLNPLALFEAMGKYPAEQKELLDFLRKTKIPGVVFLSGDRHFTELLARREPGLYPLYELTASPLTSGPAKPKDEEKNNPARIPGTWVVGVRNFSLIEVSGKEGERVLTLRTLDANGKELWRRDIKASELK